MKNAESLLECLRSASDASSRNSLALELSETGSADVLSVLVELVGRPDLKDERGTLVHCMRRFDCSEYFGLLVELVVSGNWEVANEAFGIIDDIGEISGDDVLTKYKALLRAKPSIVDEWRVGLIDQLLLMFE